MGGGVVVGGGGRGGVLGMVLGVIWGRGLSGGCVCLVRTEDGHRLCHGLVGELFWIRIGCDKRDLDGVVGAFYGVLVWGGGGGFLVVKM